MSKQLLRFSSLFIFLMMLLFQPSFAQEWLDKKRLPSVMLRNIDGELLNVAQKYGNNGKVTIFKFWSVWTLDCQQDLENTATLARRWADELDIEIVSVSLYDQKNAEDVRDYMNKRGWKFDVLVDPDDAFLKIMKAKGDVLPYTVAIDHKGLVVHEGKSNGDFLEQLKMRDVISEARSRLPKVTPAEQRMTNTMKTVNLSTTPSSNNRLPIVRTAARAMPPKPWISKAYHKPPQKKPTEVVALANVPKPKPIIKAADVPQLMKNDSEKKNEDKSKQEQKKENKQELSVPSPKLKNKDEPKQKTQLAIPNPKLKNKDEPKSKTRLVTPTPTTPTKETPKNEIAAPKEPKLKNRDEPKQKTQLVKDDVPPKKSEKPAPLKLLGNPIQPTTPTPKIATPQSKPPVKTVALPKPKPTPKKQKINWEEHFTPKPAPKPAPKVSPKPKPKPTPKSKAKPKVKKQQSPQKPRPRKRLNSPSPKPKQPNINLPKVLQQPPQIKYKNDQIPAFIDNRRVKTGKKTYLKSNQILLKVWDTQYEDGDVLSLSLNGKWVLKNHPLTKDEQEINITINKDNKNYLILYAHNEGSRPPNTAAVTIFDGDQERTFNLSSNMSSCDAINLIFTPDEDKQKKK